MYNTIERGEAFSIVEVPLGSEALCDDEEATSRSAVVFRISVPFAGQQIEPSAYVA